MICSSDRWAAMLWCDEADKAQQLLPSSGVEEEKGAPPPLIIDFESHL